MDNIETTNETTEPNFGTEIAKAAALSAVSAAGTVVGMIAIGYAVTKVTEFRKARIAKKIAEITEDK
jgi:hypothetical protein